MFMYAMQFLVTELKNAAYKKYCTKGVINSRLLTEK